MEIDPEILEIELPNPAEKICVISYPKSGRTWLRVLISRYKQLQLHISSFHLKLHSLYSPAPNYSPQFIFHHGLYRIAMNYQGSKWKQLLQTVLPPSKFNYKYEFDFTYCAGSPVIFLIRNPIDTLVSYYHHLKSRERSFKGSLDSFIRDPKYGVQPLILFMNQVVKTSQSTLSMVVSYEELRKDTKAQLAKILRFSGMLTNREYLEETIEFSSIDHMREMEKLGIYGPKLSTIDQKDPNAYKVRRGNIGTSKLELGEENMNYLSSFMSQHLDPYYKSYLK